MEALEQLRAASSLLLLDVPAGTIIHIDQMVRTIPPPAFTSKYEAQLIVLFSV